MRSLIARPYLPLVAAVIALPIVVAPAALASTGVNATSSVTPSCSGWSPASPSECGASPAAAPADSSPASSASTGSNTLSPAWVNGAGCAGYYTGSGEMHCRDTAISIYNAQIVIRTGFWNGTNGFGWSKADYYHNLAMQPMIDTIRLATPTGSQSSRDYEVYHYNADGYVDQVVVLVSDNVATSFQGVSTGDGHSVGVITGYCESGSLTIETECPAWVDSTL